MLLQVLLNAWKGGGGLSEVFGPKGGKVAGDRIKLRNDEFYNFCFSQNTTGLIERRRARWMGHLARVGRDEMHAEFWWGSMKQTGEREHLCIDGKVICKN